MSVSEPPCREAFDFVLLLGSIPVQYQWLKLVSLCPRKVIFQCIGGEKGKKNNKKTLLDFTKLLQINLVMADKQQ